MHKAHKTHRRLSVITAVSISAWLGRGRNGRSVCDRLWLLPVTAVGSCGGHPLRFVTLETDINGRCRLTGQYNGAGISQLSRPGIGLVDPALP
jgi:hypothetical protein